MPLNSDTDIAKEDRLMMPHYETAKTDRRHTVQLNTLYTSIVLDFENNSELELRHHYNVKIRDL